MATPPHCPLPTNFPLSLGVGPSHRHTPVPIVERVGGGPPQPGTKKPNLTVRLHICLAPGQAPAVPTAPPPQGPPPGVGGDGVLKSDSRHPSCAPSPPPRQELVTRTDRGLGGQREALMGRQPAFLQGSGETETQGHKEKQSPG